MWLLLAFLTAFFEASKDVTMKKSLENAHEHVVAWSWMFFALPFLIPAMLLSGIPSPDEGFWPALIAGGSLNLLAISLYVRAIKSSDLSTTVPMIAFSPLFLLVTSPLILGEFPRFWGLVGVLLIVVGAYVLNIKERHKGYLAPYKAMLHNRGPRLMLLVAFIWSIAANVDKLGVQNSSPVFWVVAVNSFVSIALLPAMLRTPRIAGHLRANLPYLLVMGLFAALVAICQMYAITLTLVAYVIAIKRTSTLMGVVFGAVLFKESGLGERLSGAAIMLLGVLCISLL